ncbi:MAG: hypothetical protein Q4D29_10975 [Lachnospiraceae bacterium]|nr:hypothetical protein [Lachnospiraceae bacterium]
MKKVISIVVIIMVLTTLTSLIAFAETTNTNSRACEQVLHNGDLIGVDRNECSETIYVVEERGWFLVFREEPELTCVFAVRGHEGRYIPKYVTLEVDDIEYDIVDHENMDYNYNSFVSLLVSEWVRDQDE